MVQLQKAKLLLKTKRLYIIRLYAFIGDENGSFWSNPKGMGQLIGNNHTQGNNQKRANIPKEESEVLSFRYKDG